MEHYLLSDGDESMQDDVHVPRVMEEIIEDDPQVRSAERIVEQIVEEPLVEALVEVDQITSQEHISERCVEQCVSVPMPEILEAIVEAMQPVPSSYRGGECAPPCARGRPCGDGPHHFPRAARWSHMSASSMCPVLQPWSRCTVALRSREFKLWVHD